MGNSSYALHRACPDEKALHSSCEATHLEAFRRGEARLEENPCRDQWEDYRACVQKLWDQKTREYLERKRGHTADTATPLSSEALPTSSFSPPMPHTDDET